MNIYTKGGDKGQTSLIGGKRVPKYSLQVEAYGTIDELKSYTGLIYDLFEDKQTKESLLKVINQLFVAESLMSIDKIERGEKMQQIKISDIEFLEKEIDRMTEQLAPLTAFILPGGHPTISHCHIARTICRRGERAYLRFLATDGEDIRNENILKYLNRLSDYFFTLARFAAKENDVEELLWQ
ncbi:MAG: ATP:cob(I)alamin adenosyltransferase [Bacteroidetes bacterium 4572_112]|nr:MAG: ATP:cob(I)alamin adenosyltransferase [Bacteroidetes bacterium 4572_112]